MKRTNTAAWDDKNQRWRIAVQKNGVRKNFYSSTPGRNGQREANRKADEWLEKDICERVRCDRALDLFVENIKERTSFSNYDVEERRVRLYIKPEIGSLFIESVTEGHLQAIIDKNTKKLAKKSLKNLRATLTAFIKFCRKNKWTDLTPEDLSISKGATPTEKAVLQPQEVQILFSSDYTTWRGKPVLEPYVAAWRFQVVTGLRPGELFGLKWTDIHDDYVYLQRSINKFKETTRGKNENAVRAFKLPFAARQIINNQPREGAYVFPVKSGTHYKDCLARYCKANNITVVTPYELRHTFVSMAKYLPEGMVKPLVGHSKDMDTFGVYGHYLEGDNEIVANELQKVFDKIIIKN